MIAVNLVGESSAVVVVINVTDAEEITSFNARQYDSAVIGGLDTADFAQSVSLSSDGQTAYVAVGEAGLQIIDLTISSRYVPHDFALAHLNFAIDNSADKTMSLSISTDRDDVITVGDFDTELTFADYHNQITAIPIRTVSQATGTTVITLTLSHSGETFVRTVYFTVY